MNEVSGTCHCGNESHPLYGSKCEDCYVEGTNSAGSGGTAMRCEAWECGSNALGRGKCHSKGLTPRQVTGRKKTG